MPQHQQRQRRKCNPNRKAGQSIFFLLLIYWQGPNHTSRSASAPARLQTEDRANELKYKYIPSKGWFKLALTYSVEAFRADPVEDAITWRKNTRPSEASTAKKGKPSKFPAPGDIWMHTNTQDNTVQVWQYSKEKKWEGCTGSFINDDGATSHPKWHTHVLCIGQVPGYIGLPVYIQRKSYEKRSKRNETDKGLRDLAPGSGGSDNDVGGSDAGGSDAGGSDAGGSDAGGSDSGGSGAGGSDAGGSDAGGSDAGGSDAEDVEPLPAGIGSGSDRDHEEQVD